MLERGDSLAKMRDTIDRQYSQYGPSTDTEPIG